MMRPQMCRHKLYLRCFCAEWCLNAAGVSVSNSQRPSFDNASCDFSSSEWHVGCDIDHVIMDFDMKQINKTKEPSETTNGHVLASHCNLVSSKCTTYKVCTVHKFVIMCMRSTLC